MQEIKREHRFFAFFIDCVIMNLIVIICDVYIHMPHPPYDPTNRIDSLLLIFKGVCLMITGSLEIFSIGNPVLIFINTTTKDITHSLSPITPWLYILYYFIFEALFKTTPGKMIFGLNVASTGSKKLTVWNFVIRTLSRLLPFEVFSCIPHGKSFWHDRLSKTCLVYKSKGDNKDSTDSDLQVHINEK